MHGLQSPLDFLGTICSGEAQGLPEGCMIPKSNMCSNPIEKFELLFWGETSNSGGEWWAGCTDIVCNVAIDKGYLDSCESG